MTRHINFKGNILKIAIFYLVFWAVFYGSMLVMPVKWLFYLYTKFADYMQYYNLFIIPGLSLFLPLFFQKKLRLKLWFLYLVHILVMCVLVFLFIHFFSSRVFDTPVL